MDEIKSCPRCGKPSHVVDLISDYGTMYSVACNDPDCMFFEPTRAYSTVDKAIEAWNERDVEIVHCRDCVHFRRQTPTDRARCDGVFAFVEPDGNGFCSWGKRVEDAD